MKKKLLYLSIMAINQNWHNHYPMSYTYNEYLEGAIRYVPERS